MRTEAQRDPLKDPLTTALDGPPMSQLLTDEEIHRLLMMLGYGQPNGFSEADFHVVVQWAESVRMGAAVLDNVLEACMAVCVADGDVAFRPTPKGERQVEEMIRAAGAGVLLDTRA